jgi:hypothetical protein
MVFEQTCCFRIKCATEKGRGGVKFQKKKTNTKRCDNLLMDGAFIWQSHDRMRGYREETESRRIRKAEMLQGFGQTEVSETTR